jgi:hypothetical protein
MSSTTAVTLTVAGIVVTITPSVLLLVALLIAATGCFLRWYVHLAPRRRADVLALIRSLRRP